MLRTTVIMKTDISGSTARFRALADAARLAMRIVVTIGDVLHEDGALVGDAVVLTTRIEAITPPDEIYLSAAAWLVVNPAEIRTAPVDRFSLKGFAEPVAVYRIEQTHRTRTIVDECIVWTDLRGFVRLLTSEAIPAIERILETLLVLVHHVAREFRGTVRFGIGDAYCVTFVDAGDALGAAERLGAAWTEFAREQKLPVALNVAVHRGTLYAFRSYLYGSGLETASHVEAASRAVLGPDEGGVFVTAEVRRHVAGSAWERRLAATGLTIAGRDGDTTILRLVTAEDGPA